jgi:hypothetical protein
MVSKSEAIEIASRYLDDVNKNARPSRFGPPARLVILNENVTETWYGWVFDVVGEEFQRTKDPRYVIVGGIGTIIVLKNSGSVHTLGTSVPPETALSEFEKRLPIQRG